MGNCNGEGIEMGDVLDAQQKFMQSIIRTAGGGGLMMRGYERFKIGPVDGTVVAGTVALWAFS
jgi:hypothetical protein